MHMTMHMQPLLFCVSFVPVNKSELFLKLGEGDEERSRRKKKILLVEHKCFIESSSLID